MSLQTARRARWRFVLAAAVVGGAWAAAAAAPATMGDWVRLPAKHNGSGVALSHRLPKQPLDVGQPATVELRFEGTPGARVSLRAPAGVAVRLADGSALPEAMDIPAGGMSVQVQPLAEGLHYLVVSTTRNGRRSVQAVPLKVGGAAPQLAHDGKVDTTPAGEAVISLPARP